MKDLILKSPAKLNLYLDVLNKRRDGFHNILTLFEKIDLCDRLYFRENKNGKINVLCTDIPQKENLVYKVAKILKRDFLIPKGVDIYIEKKIPVSAGLGGGSSNAASCLLGLNRFLNLKIKKERLLDYAKRIGCDVPFFISESSFALGFGRGDRVLPLEIKKKLWHVLIIPNIKVSTKKIYQRYECQAVRKKSLNSLIFALKDNSLFKKNLLFNTLEEVSSKFFKIIKKLKKILKDLEIKAISMSGSGPAVFGIVSSRKEGKEICSKLDKVFGDGFQFFLVKTY